MNSTQPLGLRADSELAADPAFTALLCKLETESLERVVMRVSKEQQISVSEAILRKNQFLRFFALAEHSRSALAPTLHIDTFWHEFILFTADYMTFCDRHIGHYFHHQPFDDKTPAELVSAAIDVGPLLSRHFLSDTMQAEQAARRVCLPCARSG